MLAFAVIQLLVATFLPSAASAGYLLQRDESASDTLSTASSDASTLATDTSSAISTVDSFKHWDTCMDNHVCKPVAITGIVLAAIVFILIMSCIVNSLCCAIRCVDNLLCCCHSRRRDNYGNNLSHKGFAPLPEPQYVQQVDPIYYNAGVHNTNNGDLRYGPTSYK